MPTQTKQPRDPSVLAELRALAERARGGDATVLPQMRKILDRHPEIWQFAGDLERSVVRQWTDLLSDGDPLSTETVRRKAEELRAELEGENPAPIERLLVGQIVAHWLEMSHAQLLIANPGKATPSQASHNLKRAESAQRRYLAAIKMLTNVRQHLPRGLLPLNPLRVHEPVEKMA